MHQKTSALLKLKNISKVMAIFLKLMDQQIHLLKVKWVSKRAKNRQNLIDI